MSSILMQLALILTLLYSVSAQTCANVNQYITAVSYVYPCPITTPSCAWYSFVNGADTVIINPNSGPGSAADSNYVNLISSIRSSNSYTTTIVGYVATGYGSKSSTAAKAEIANYNSFYKVDGIFFDEVNTSCATVPYYSGLVQYVQSTTKSPTKQDYTIHNWGQNGPECFFSGTNPADTFVTFEGPYALYSSYTPLSYMAKYPTDRFYHIVYNVSQGDLISTMTKSKTNRAGYIYVTNDNGDSVTTNPYDSAPTPYAAYWQKEVQKAAQSC